MQNQCPHRKNRSSHLAWRLACSAALLCLVACHGEKTQPDRIPPSTQPLLGTVGQVYLPPGPAAASGAAGYCLTVAGYCPLPGSAPEKMNCICQGESLAYGGKTGAAPPKYTAP